MILPNKYINYSQSIISSCDTLLGLIVDTKQERYIEDFWNLYKKNDYGNFSRFYQSLLVLIMLDLVDVNKEGEIYDKENK